jgi:hypothetical protein
MATHIITRGMTAIGTDLIILVIIRPIIGDTIITVPIIGIIIITMAMVGVVGI